ncbi:choline/ethanolamine kinase-like isoform X2 [Mytilus californianus]|nr:choline/ethanolamine kinase-like isoform X2 [Mytilus californianus]XP_052066712.1 choline/ethanolamine kinase-like isoform X2 [Mytilus californianus]
MAQAQAPPRQDVTYPYFFQKRKRECLELCKAQFSIDDSNFTCEEIGRPTTNHIYKCTWRANGQEHKQVLVRIYGKIAKEQFPTFLINNLCVFLLLAKLNLGPKCYGFSDKGRIEELYTCEHLQRSDLTSGTYAELIARKLAEIHEQDMPLPKAPTFLIDFCAPRIANIQRWLLTTEITQGTVRTIDSFDFRHNLREVRRATVDLKSEVVFSHNGLTEGDILRLTEETDLLASLKLIDFEYSAYNYRAYDLSMLFIECCIEYRNVPDTPYFKFNNVDYPDPEIRKQICEAYLMARSNTGDPTEGDVNRLLHETEICELAVHLMWAIWGVDQHIRGEKISFGYLEYAVVHLNEYIKKKKHRLP